MAMEQEEETATWHRRGEGDSAVGGAGEVIASRSALR